MFHGQKEEYLGVPVSQLQFIESNLEATLFYYVDTSGRIQVLEIPPEVKADGWGSVLTTLYNVLGSLLFVAGTILIFTPLSPIGFKMAFGGLFLLGAEAFKEEISWFLMEVLGAEGAQLAGGGISVLIGATTYKIGTKLLGKGITGTTLGILLNIIGELLMLAGTAEISEVILDYNFIKEWTGISDILYSDIYRTLTFASTVSIITYYLLSSFYEAYNNRPVQKLKRAGASEDAIKAYKDYSKNNWGKLEGYKKPSIYNNSTKPKLPEGNYMHYYTKLTMNKKMQGIERFVLNTSDGTLWYTPDHYKSWFKIKGGY